MAHHTRVSIGILLLCACGVLWPAVLGAASDDSIVQFGLITDVHAHDTDSPGDGKWMSNTEARLDAFTDAMNSWTPDFVVELGDFVNGWLVLGGTLGDSTRIPSILAWADSLYGRFDGPRYHVIGNHDVYNLDKAQYRTTLGIDATTYSFDVGAYHFIVLDVQLSEDGADLANTWTGVGGFVPDVGLEWLRLDLATSDAPTIVFVHQMLDAYVEEWGRAIVANQPEIQALLASDGDVIAVFQGHDHDNVHQTIDEIHYVTFEAVVDQDTPPSWAQITLDPTARTINIAGVGDQTSYELMYGP